MSGRHLAKIIISLLAASVFMSNMISSAQPSTLKKGWLEGNWSHYTTEDGLSSNMVFAIAVEGNYIWFGTYGGGASCYNNDTGEWKVYTTKWQPAAGKKTRPGFYWENTLEDNHVVAIATAATHDVWFGTTFYGYGDVYGVSRFVRNPSPRWTVYGLADGILCSDITSLALDSDFVWVGTQKGLARYSRKVRTWAFIKSLKQLSDLYINSIAIDSQNVWIGTGRGMTVYSKETKEWKSYTTKDGLPEDSIQSIAIEGTNIWVGGTYGRLAVMDKREGVWKMVATGDGLDDKWIKNIVSDGRNIWIARDGGVNCYNIATGNWLALTSEDGLIDNLVNAIAIDGATVWFGTGAGISKLTLR